jgi:hypothetical protein
MTRWDMLAVLIALFRASEKQEVTVEHRFAIKLKPLKTPKA